MGKGRVFVYRDDLTRFDEFYEIKDAAVPGEQQRYCDAVTVVLADLSLLVAQVKKELDSDMAAIFEAHKVILQDAQLKAEVEKEIKEQLVSAGLAVKTVFRRWERRFCAMENTLARQKGDDMRDLARRLLGTMSGTRAHELERMPPGSVLVANRLLPSDTVFLGRRRASAAVVEVGGAASHAALFAHEIGLPCLAGIPRLLDKVSHDTLALVDADSGEVTLNPSREEINAFDQRRERRDLERRSAQASSHKPAITRDGKAVRVVANVGCYEDTKEAIGNGAEGVGLYRIERIYLGLQQPPGVDNLLENMRQTLMPARGLSVCVRLLDVGADKPLPFLETYRELNPALGCRGIRFLRKYPNLLRVQLKALLQLVPDFDLQILVPMVTLPSDMQFVREELAKVADQTGSKSIPKLGAMIETPAAALSAADIAPFADFLSFGTNDLTQYSFAADRENAAVDSYFDDGHRVVFELMRLVRRDVPQLPLSICGELASRSHAIEKILQCGITSFSVAAPSVAMVKQAIRLASCQRV